MSDDKLYMDLDVVMLGDINQLMNFDAQQVIPFMRERDARGNFAHPPLHLRDWTAEELKQHRRMIRKQEETRIPFAPPPSKE